jgi:hypothetical protein
MPSRDLARRLARLERRGRGGAEVDALRREVERLMEECERERDDRRFCRGFLRFVEASSRLHQMAPEPDRVERPAARTEGMTDEQAEAYLNALTAATPGGGPHDRFAEVSTEGEVDAYLALFQVGGRDGAHA